MSDVGMGDKHKEELWERFQVFSSAAAQNEGGRKKWEMWREAGQITKKQRFSVF